MYELYIYKMQCCKAKEINNVLKKLQQTNLIEKVEQKNPETRGAHIQSQLCVTERQSENYLCVLVIGKLLVK